MIEHLAGKRILVVAAHPDDELLGAGATMHRLIHRFGCTVRAVILGEGLTSRADQRDRDAWNEELERLRANTARAALHIGFQSFGVYEFPDNRFDSVALLDIVKVVEAEKRTFLPDVIFTHHGGDLNIDHRRTFEAVVTATRPMEGERVRSIFSFETPSATEWQAANAPLPFLPNMFIPVSEQDLQAKLAAMGAYEQESRPFPHPRSPQALETLARRWGVAVGCPLAEAFMLVRSVSD